MASKPKMTVSKAHLIAMTHDSTEPELRDALERLHRAAFTVRNESYIDMIERRLVREDFEE